MRWPRPGPRQSVCNHLLIHPACTYRVITFVCDFPRIGVRMQDKPSGSKQIPAAAGSSSDKRVSLKAVRQFMKLGGKTKHHTSSRRDSSTEDERRYDGTTGNCDFIQSIYLIWLIQVKTQWIATSHVSNSTLICDKDNFIDFQIKRPM